MVCIDHIQKYKCLEKDVRDTYIKGLMLVLAGWTILCVCIYLFNRFLHNVSITVLSVWDAKPETILLSSRMLYNIEKQNIKTN